MTYKNSLYALVFALMLVLTVASSLAFTLRGGGGSTMQGSSAKMQGGILDIPPTPAPVGSLIRNDGFKILRNDSSDILRNP